MNEYKSLKEEQFSDPDKVKKIMKGVLRNEWYRCNRGPRPSVAMLFTKDHYMPGYVQPTFGLPSCIDVGCEMEDGHCVRNIHAEVEALLSCAKIGIATNNSVMFTVNKPCYNCMKALAKAGVSTVFYAFTVYDEQRTLDVAAGAGIELIHVEGFDGSE